MNVIGHDGKGIQFSQREVIRDILQTTPGDCAGIVQPHYSIHDLAEQAFPIPRADRHEIGARLRIVVSLQADGTAMVSVRRVSHYWSLASRYDSSRPNGTGPDLGGLRLPVSMPYRCPRFAPCFAWARGVAVWRLSPQSDRRGSPGP